MGTGPSSARDRGGDRDRFAARRRSFESWYVNSYPAWLGYGYPYVIDPGFYDWGNSDNSVYDESGAVPNYLAPNPDYGYGVQGDIPPASAQDWQRSVEVPNPSSPPAPAQTLMVIFKGDRAPIRIHNYMITAEVLTDLDSEHNEKISMDEIDVAATQWINGAAGVGFEIPGANRN
jgi:hypothetical protein